MDEAKIQMASEGDCWRRTGKKEVDQLHYYLTGELYDCSFKVGFKQSGYKIFKCQKMILSMASEVFEKMFSGSFKEASLGKDDPIILEKVTPNAFDITMKFIYGNYENFEDVPTAVQVYKFAHEMQIVCLFEPLDKYLKSNTVPDNVLAVLGVYTFVENDEALEYYSQVLLNDTVAAFRSPSWQVVSQQTIENVLQLDVLPIDEVDLFQSLLEWGKSQVLSDIGEVDHTDFDTAENAEMLREKVLPLFKFIQFASMDPLCFAELCKVLTNEEMLKIFMAITFNSSEVLPKLLASVSKRNKYIAIALPYYVARLNQVGYQNATLSFSLDKEAYLLGLQIDPSDLNFGIDPKHLTITLSSNNTGESKSFNNLTLLNSDTGNFIKLVPTPWTLKKGVYYTLTFCTSQRNNCNLYSIAANNFKPLTCNGITVNLNNQNVYVHLTKLMICLAGKINKT